MVNRPREGESPGAASLWLTDPERVNLELLGCG